MEDSTNMYMPVAPAYGAGANQNGFGFGGDWAWILLLLVLFGNNGWGNGFGGYSEYGMYPMNNYPYENGNSYARGRYMPRNNMGQFTSREGSYNYGYNGGNQYRNGNYSMTDAKSEFVDHLYNMMQNAPNEQMRDRMQKMIHDMEQQ